MNAFTPGGHKRIKWRTVTETIREWIVSVRPNHRALGAAAVVGQDRERKRIASELHDGLGQTLTLIKLTVEDARIRLGGGNRDEARALLDTAVERLCEAIGDMRQICNELHPVLLERLGLIASLASICQRMDERAANVRVRFESRLEDVDVPDALRTDIFRVTQEALTNALRHGSATAIYVRLRREKDGLWLTIEDDGVGFDALNAIDPPRAGRPTAAGDRTAGDPAADDRATTGLGLIGMRRRVEAGGGELVIQSSATGGTFLSAFWSV